MAKGKKKDGDYTNIVANKKFAVDVLDPKKARRDNVRILIRSDDGKSVFHHFRGYEVTRLIRALEAALEFGPKIPET